MHVQIGIPIQLCHFLNYTGPLQWNYENVGLDFSDWVYKYNVWYTWTIYKICLLYTSDAADE